MNLLCACGVAFSSEVERGEISIVCPSCTKALRRDPDTAPCWLADGFVLRSVGPVTLVTKEAS